MGSVLPLGSAFGVASSASPDDRRGRLLAMKSASGSQDPHSPAVTLAPGESELICSTIAVKGCISRLRYCAGFGCVWRRT